MKSILLFTVIALSSDASAALSDYAFSVDPIVVKASSSFESLSDDSFIPQKKIDFDQTRAGTLDTLDKKEPFPSVNYGYPSGAMGSSLGGRSLDDTQVSTLGVPLNLPQGGGPDLSFFPSFLWSGASISSVPTVAGFSPQGVSGSMQLHLWTRDQVRELKRSTNVSRITFNVDRNLQNGSVATKTDNIAILAGMNQGRQKGPAASLSYYFIREPRRHFLFHMLGSDQDGDSPGDKTFAMPAGRKKTWRVIPAIESHQDFGSEEEHDLVTWESTAYADLHQMIFENAGVVTSNTRTQTFGVENALHWDKNLIALTVRIVNFQSKAFGQFSEYPVIGQYSRDFTLSDAWKMRLTGGGNYVSSSVGLAPTGRASFKNTLNQEDHWFFELNSLPKMPTLASRYYVYSTYHGNPDLKAERVNAAIAGFEHLGNPIESTTTLKTEYRTRIHVNKNNTTENAGDATLVSLLEDFKWKATPHYTARGGLLLTYSRLLDSKYTYPDLPYFSLLWGSSYAFSDSFKLNHDIRYMGSSTTAQGGIHEAYLLMNMSLDYLITNGITLTLGCENLDDSRAEVVVDSPLPGRILYLNLVANL